MKSGAGVFTDPRKHPSQGDNPNIALTRPRKTDPLTLVDPSPAVHPVRGTPSNDYPHRSGAGAQ
ncbi:hypothetical protein GCM10009851_29790 [Herbiconiux moechotypicola]|uniref:Uncharacterized protein n=1 Tax=Herbiconiux moechotypicola TaxID=637393 RepID=A0ABN3DVH8_9MICO